MQRMFAVVSPLLLTMGVCLTSVAIGQTAPTNPVTPIAVSVRSASELFVYPRRQASATVLARNESRISAQLASPVIQILADTAGSVAAGDVLARLDDADAKLSVAQARANRDGLLARLRLAQRQLKRLRELKTNNFVSTEAVNQRDAEVVNLRAQLKAGAAQLAVAQRQLDKCVIRAPFDAVVSARHAQLGELTAPGSPLFTLVQIGNEEIAAAISTADADHIQPDGRFEFVGRGRSYPIIFKRVSPVVSAATRTREARFSFQSASIPAGTQGRVVWPDTRSHLPPQLLVRRGGRIGVFVVRDDKAGFVALDGAQEGRPAVASLPAGTSVIVAGQTRLQAGQAVSVNAN